MQHPQKKKEKKTPSRWWLAALLSLIVLALAAVVVVQRLHPAPKGKLYPDPAPVLNYETLQVNDTEQLSSITVSHREGESYTLRYQDGVLLLERDGQLLDLNDSLCAELIKAVSTIAIEDVVTRDATEVTEHLADMGLEPPKMTVTITYTDGRQDVLFIGNGVPNTTYSYYRWSGDAGIYMCDAGIPEIFGYTANQLLPVTQPQLEGDLVDRLVITKPTAQMELTLSVDAAGVVTGAMETPVTYPLALDSAAALITALNNFRLGTPLGDAEALSAENGFDDPICTVDIHQREGMFTRINEAGEMVVETMPAQQLRFVFGRAEGEYFYTCAYEGQAYLVSRFLVEPLVAAAPEKLVTLHPANIGTIPAQIDVETENGSFTVVYTQTLRVTEDGQPELSENGEWLCDNSAAVNGQEVPYERAEALVNRLCNMSFSGTVPKDWSPGDALPRWRISLTQPNGAVRTLTAYRLDAFTDAVAVDGVLLHCCYTEALEMALGDWIP